MCQQAWYDVDQAFNLDANALNAAHADLNCQLWGLPSDDPKCVSLCALLQPTSDFSRAALRSQSHFLGPRCRQVIRSAAVRARLHRQRVRRVHEVVVRRRHQLWLPGRLPVQQVQAQERALHASGARLPGAVCHRSVHHLLQHQLQQGPLRIRRGPALRPHPRTCRPCTCCPHMLRVRVCQRDEVTE